jgi:hypothetical protein
VTLHERAAVMARKAPEAGGVGRLPPVPTQGAMAPRAGEGRRADPAPPGVEQHGAVWQDPGMVTRLFLKKPARSDAWGLVFWRARR